MRAAVVRRCLLGVAATRGNRRIISRAFQITEILLLTRKARRRCCASRAQSQKSVAAKLGAACMPEDKLRSSSPQGNQKRTSDLAELLSWQDTCQRIHGYAKSWNVVVTELLAKLKSGQVRSICRTVQGDKSEDHKLAPTFWEEIKIDQYDNGLRPRLGAWEREQRAKNALPAWWPSGRPVYFFMNLSDVDQCWPASRDPHEVTVVRDDRRKPGPKPQIKWRALAGAELIRIVHFDGIPENDTEVSKEIWQFLLKEMGDGPNLSEVRAWVTELLSRVRGVANSS